MRESYVRPVTRGREPKSEAVAVWRFRLIAVVLLTLVVLGVVWGYNRFNDLRAQDPSFDSLRAPVSSLH